MATSIKATRRFVVTLNLPGALPALISYAENIVKRITGNPSFASPAPALSAVTAAHRRSTSWGLAKRTRA